VNLAMQGLVVNHCLLAAVVVLLAVVRSAGGILSDWSRAGLTTTWIMDG
jgi:hypothetical protein